MHDNFPGVFQGVFHTHTHSHTDGLTRSHVNFMQFVMFYVRGCDVTPGNLKMTDFNLYNLFY